MAIIDYHLVQNGLYAKLSPSSRILIPVLSTLCDNYTGEIPAKQAKASYLALKAGLTPKSVRAALKELAQDQYKIVALEMGSGRISSIQYRPVVRLAKQNASKPVTSTSLPPFKPVTITEQTGNHYRFNFDSSTPETAPEPAETQSSTNLAQPLLSLNNRFKQTTTGIPIPRILIKAMTKRYGSDVVVSVISGMEKKITAGEEIHNPGAYFRKCCQNGWQPTSKAIQEKEKLTEQQAREKERQERERQLHNEHSQRVAQEQADPDTMARIKEVQNSFWENTATATQEAAG